MDALDAIEGLDDGAYSHFGHQVGQYPGIVEFMQPAYYYSSYVGVAVLFAIVMLLFLVQGKRRAAVVAFVSFASAVALAQVLHMVIPRHPPNADKWLGPDPSTGSYPSASVFLFTLCLILLGLALWDRMGLRMRGVFVLIAAALVGWVCMSGFFLALHYVTDVIGGLAGAALTGWIASRFIGENSERATGFIPVGQNPARQPVPRG